MLINPRNIGYWRILGGYYGGKDYLIVVRFDTPMNDKPYQDFHTWALNFFEGLYSTLPSQRLAGVFIGPPDELKKRDRKGAEVNARRTNEPTQQGR